MSRPKAKGTTMLDVKFKKLTKRFEAMQLENTQLRLGTLNMRQMVQAAQGERDGMGMKLATAESMLVAVVTNTRKKVITIKKSTFEDLENWGGIDANSEGDELILTALSVEDVQKMQDEIEEMQAELEVVEAEIVGEEE